MRLAAATGQLTAMPPKTLKGSVSSSALKTAASMALRGGDKTAAKELATVKFPSVGPGNSASATWAPKKSNGRPGFAATTVWDDEQCVATPSRQLESLTAQVRSMDAVFQEEARARSEQHQLEDELHADQLRRLGEIGVEIDESIARLTVHIDAFTSSSREMLAGTFNGLHGDLRARIDGLLPRIKELGVRGQAVRAGLEEEQAARIRETAEILVPLREQIEKLATQIKWEQKVRETRNAEIQHKMDQAVVALNGALDSEISSREQRVAQTAQEWRHDQEQLLKRQDRLEGGLTRVQEELSKEIGLEGDHRIAAQDSVVEALTGFIQRFQANAKEQSHVGN